jgi:hypothetical protein
MAPVVVLALTLILALSLMVVTVAAAGVAALQLRRAVGKLTGGVQATLDRARPLVEDLQQGAVVAAAEAEALQQSVERLQSERRRRR